MITYTTSGMLCGATQLQLGVLAPSLRPVDTRTFDGSRTAEALARQRALKMAPDGITLLAGASASSLGMRVSGL